MKKRIMWPLICFLIMSAINCSKDKQESLSLSFQKEFGNLECISNIMFGKKDSIIGKWKLVQTLVPVDAGNGMTKYDTIDVSCDNIYFEFKKGGLLTIIGNKDDIYPGNYNYLYRPIPSHYTVGLPAPNFQIEGHKEIFCFVYEYKMELTNLGKRFVRVE